jgi:hypothetical protein
MVEGMLYRAKHDQVMESELLGNLPFYDLLFIGSNAHGRRKAFVNDLIEKTQRDKRLFLATGHLTYIDLFDIYSREFYVIHTKMMLSIHQFPESILETHRINHFLSYGKCIISENSVLDPFLDDSYNESVVFTTNHEEVYSISIQYLDNDEQRRQCEKAAFLKYQKINSDVKILTFAMNEILTENQLYSVYMV